MSILTYDAYHGRMASVLGRNVVSGHEQFSLSVDDVICGQIDLGCNKSEICLHIMQHHCWNF